MGRPRQFDEKHVLRAVREQFWNAGYAATSLEDLKRVSGLGKGSLYAAFGDKHQLFLRALRSYNDANDSALRKHRSGHHDADGDRTVAHRPTPAGRLIFVPLYRVRLLEQRRVRSPHVRRLRRSGARDAK
jgi:AcrR family transcriptional regulator